MDAAQEALRGEAFRHAVGNALERRLFYIPSFKIYRGVAELYDYGPPGCAVKVKANALAFRRQGVFGSAFQVSVTAWCLHKKGPLFVAMFHPLGIVISAVLGIIFLGDILYLGSAG